MTNKKQKTPAKSLHNTPVGFIKGSPVIFTVVVFLLLTVVVTLALLWQFPNNVTHPNYYGEDGSVYLQNIINKGWLHAIFTPFNGYEIVGLYGIEWLGWILNMLFGGGSLLTLPAYFAFVSILFMAFVITLPYVLFSSTFGKGKMLLVVAFSALLPLPSSPHIVLGTVGNQKWIFLYLAFLVTLYWLIHRRTLTWPKVTWLGLILLLCAHTNTTTYLLIPVLFLPILKDMWDARKQKGLKTSFMNTLRTKEVIGLLAISVLLVPQVLYVLLHGIPKLPGYLDTPYQFHKSIELFVYRTYLFGVTHLFNKFMGNLKSLVLLAILLFVGIRLLKGMQRVAFLLGVYTAGIASLLFVINRPGVTDFFNSYQPSGSGPDQFFYAQTLIMYLPIVLAAFGFAALFRHRWLRSGLLAIFVIFVLTSGVLSSVLFGARWRNASVFENYASTFIDQSIIACNTQKGNSVKVTVYPYASGQFALRAPRNQICSSTLKQYQPSYASLGLSVNNNDFRVLSKQYKFTQTFTADEPRLNGIRIFLSDFTNYRRRGVYTLALYDKTCAKQLRIVAIPITLLDNTYYNARFPEVSGSKGQSYCFTIDDPQQAVFDPVAIQLSAPNIYDKGRLLESGQPSASDAVFQPLYTQTKPATY